MSDHPEPSQADLLSESREIWDINAAAFDERVSSGGGWQSILIAPTVERMLDVQPGETALDLACGNGIFSRRLADLGATVVAADFSPKFIELARERSAEYADRIAYHVADATDEAQLLALAGDEQRRFDLACCNMALMDMPAIAPLFRAVAQLLKPERALRLLDHAPVLQWSGDQPRDRTLRLCRPADLRYQNPQLPLRRGDERHRGSRAAARAVLLASTAASVVQCRL